MAADTDVVVAAAPRAAAADNRLPAAVAARWLACWLALFALALLISTWALWTPQHVFPQVPAFAWLLGMPDGWQWLCLAGLIGALLAILATPRGSARGRAALIAFVVAAVCSTACDQHRWQPWMYQMVLTALAVAALPPERSCLLLRWLTISIYLYSAASKCNAAYLNGLGQQFLAALANLVGQSVDDWNWHARRALAATFPAGEVLCALALMWPPARRWGLWGAIAGHTLLIVLLGPWGLQQRSGVLLWNGWFIVQDWLLFASPPHWLRRQIAGAAASSSAEDRSAPYLAGAVQFVFAVAWLMPLTTAWDYWDRWPSWQLYAPRSERVQVLIARDQTGRLSAEARDHLEPLPDDVRWEALRLDRWSLAALGVPLYPQSRFEWGAASAIAERADLADDIRIIVRGNRDRRFGQAARDELRGAAQIEKGAGRYWLNARGRW